MALSQKWIGELREDHASLRAFFPGCTKRSRSTRRTRDRWSVILTARISAQVVLDALVLEEASASDSAPAPCVGYKRAKAASDGVGTTEDGVYCSVGLVVSLTGVIMGVMPTSQSLREPARGGPAGFACASPHATVGRVCFQ